MSDWVQVSVTVAQARVAAAEAVLFATGAASVTLLDAGDSPVHEPPPGTTPLWPQTIVQGLFPADTPQPVVVEALRDADLIATPTAVEFARLAERDWTRAWMDRYCPLRFGRDLWICPWHIEPEPDWPLVIRLDPGLAFGSGTHPTTALCLEWIDAHDLEDATIIDYGCGSGVLAIACALKGAGRILAVDHDCQALQATADNARRNGVGTHIHTLGPEAFNALAASERRASVVLANILAGPLTELAPTLAGCLQADGKLVLSGILAEQGDDLVRAYAGHAQVRDRRSKAGWMRLVLARA